MIKLKSFSVPFLITLLSVSQLKAQNSKPMNADTAAVSVVQTPQLSEMQISSTTATVSLENATRYETIRLRYRNVNDNNWICMEYAAPEQLKLQGLDAETNYEVRIVIVQDKMRSPELGFCFTTATKDEALNRITEENK